MVTVQDLIDTANQSPDKIGSILSYIQCLIDAKLEQPSDKPVGIRFFTEKQKVYVANRDGYKCIYCGEPAHDVDHVIPWSQSGPTIVNNAVIACVKCNNQKGGRIDQLNNNLVTQGLLWLLQRHEDLSWLNSFVPHYKTRPITSVLPKWSSVGKRRT